jgi:hypothetical protein
MNAQRIQKLLHEATINVRVGKTKDDVLGFTELAAEFARLVEVDVRELCAQPLDAAAARLVAGKRTNQVDRHTADILETHAKVIRAGEPIDNGEVQAVAL